MLTLDIEKKTVSILVHSLLLWDGANSGITLSITTLRCCESKPLVEAKIIVLGPALSTCFEWMKTTCPAGQNIQQHTHLSLPLLTSKMNVLGMIMLVSLYLRSAPGWWPFGCTLATSNSKLITKLMNNWYLLVLCFVYCY